MKGCHPSTRNPNAAIQNSSSPLTVFTGAIANRLRSHTVATPCHSMATTLAQKILLIPWRVDLAMLLADDHSIDDGANAMRGVLERITVIQGDVTVFAHLERSHSIGDSQQFRCRCRDQAECIIEGAAIGAGVSG